MRPLAVLFTFAVAAGPGVAFTPKKQSAFVARSQMTTEADVVSVPAAVPVPNASCGGAARAGLAVRADIPRAATEAPVRSAIRRLVVGLMEVPLFNRGGGRYPTSG